MRHLQPDLSNYFPTLQSFASLHWTWVIALILPPGLTWLMQATAPLVGCEWRSGRPLALLHFKLLGITERW